MTDIEALNLLIATGDKVTSARLDYLQQTLGLNKLFLSEEFNQLKQGLRYLRDNSGFDPSTADLSEFLNASADPFVNESALPELPKEKYYITFDNWIQGKDNVNWYGRANTPQNNNWGQDSDAQVFNMGTNVNNIFYTNTNIIMPFACKLVNVVGRLKQNAYRDADLKFLNFTSDKINVFNIQEVLNIDVPANNTLNFVFDPNLTLPQNSFLTSVFKQRSGTVGAFNFYLVLTFEKI
jgi:hypothetical protein